MRRSRRWQEGSLGVRGSRRSARTEVGALERASADAAERIAVTLRKLKLWCAVVGTRSAGGRKSNDGVHELPRLCYPGRT